MSEIKVREYVRTEKGYIGKIIRLNTGTLKNTVTVKDSEGEFWIEKEDIVKHSKNIIDLIEVGDFVNGHKILEVRQDLESGLRYLMYDYIPIKYYVENTDKINSILTHEQYEENCFKVGDVN